MVNFWDITPRMDLLLSTEPNEAYLTAAEGEKYVLYFPGEGSVSIDLTNFKQDFVLKWISVKNGEWGNSDTINGGRLIEINTPSGEGWFAVMVRV
jgi:hypothetical protein